MSNTHILRLFSLTALTAGSVLSFLSEGALIGSILSGQGALAGSEPEAVVMLSQGPVTDLRFIEKYEQAAHSQQLAIGILLILLGFFLHGYIVLKHERGEREVHIHSTSKLEHPRWKKNQWFWVEMRI